jgi:hypothetical protein
MHDDKLDNSNETDRITEQDSTEDAPLVEVLKKSSKESSDSNESSNSDASSKAMGSELKKEDILDQYTESGTQVRRDEVLHCEHCGHPQVIAFKRMSYNPGKKHDNHITYFWCSGCGGVTALNIIHDEQRVYVNREKRDELSGEEWRALWE